MLTFKRALVLAAGLITMLFLITRSHNPPAVANEVMPAGTEAQEDSAERPRPISSAQTQAPPEKPMAVVDTERLKQRPMQDMSKAPLYEKLAYQFPYDLETRFPAYIWQTWKYTPASSDFGDNLREPEASWSEMHPGFIHEVITDPVAVHLLRHLYAAVPEVLEAYHALPMPVLKADFFRYLILLARGGIYSDIDTTALKSAVEWLPQHVPRESVGLVVGIEADPDRPDWAEWYSRRIQFCQWTIQAKAGHPVLRDIVANITLETLKRRDQGKLHHFDGNNVIEFTGPALWTDLIMNYLNNPTFFLKTAGQGDVSYLNFTGMTRPKKVGDVVILPITSFSPGVEQMGAGDYDDPLAFVKHDFEGSWKPESERHIGETSTMVVEG